MDEYLTVVEGLPDEPDAYDEDAICVKPGPGSFFDMLFASLANTSIDRSSPIIESTTHDDDWEASKGFCGQENIGLRFEELRSRETSAIDMRCVWETYGLPGVQVRWEFFLSKAGQLGFAAFRHQNLRVNFRDHAAQARFVEIWQKVFSTTPVFQQATASE